MTDQLAGIERRPRQLEDERDIARLIASYGPLVDAGDAETHGGSSAAPRGDWMEPRPVVT